MTELLIATIKTCISINNRNVFLKNVTENKTIWHREPVFLLGELDGFLPSIWGAESRIHGEDLADVVAEIAD
jgi:hypothetical protein